MRVFFFKTAKNLKFEDGYFPNKILRLKKALEAFEVFGLEVG